MSQHVLPHLLSPAVRQPSAALYLCRACCCLPLLILFITRSRSQPAQREGGLVIVHPSAAPLLYTPLRLCLPTSPAGPRSWEAEIWLLSTVWVLLTVFIHLNEAGCPFYFYFFIVINISKFWIVSVPVENRDVPAKHLRGEKSHVRAHTKKQKHSVSHERAPHILPISIFHPEISKPKIKINK